MLFSYILGTQTGTNEVSVEFNYVSLMLFIQHNRYLQKLLWRRGGIPFINKTPHISSITSSFISLIWFSITPPNDIVLCSVSVEHITSNWCLPLLLSHYSVISLILNSNSPCEPKLCVHEGKNLGSNQAWYCLSSFRRSSSSVLLLYHACSLLRASAEMPLIIPSSAYGLM